MYYNLLLLFIVIIIFSIIFIYCVLIKLFNNVSFIICIFRFYNLSFTIYGTAHAICQRVMKLPRAPGRVLMALTNVYFVSLSVCLSFCVFVCLYLSVCKKPQLKCKILCIFKSQNAIIEKRCSPWCR